MALKTIKWPTNMKNKALNGFKTIQWPTNMKNKAWNGFKTIPS